MSGCLSCLDNFAALLSCASDFDMCKQKVTAFLRLFLSDFHDFTPTSLDNEYSKIQCVPDVYHGKQDNGLLLSVICAFKLPSLKNFGSGKFTQNFPWETSSKKNITLFFKNFFFRRKTKLILSGNVLKNKF